MLDIKRIMDIANDLGVKVRFDREPGIYEEDGTFNSYESVMEGFINSHFIIQNFYFNKTSKLHLENEYNKKNDTVFLNKSEFHFNLDDVSKPKIISPLAA